MHRFFEILTRFLKILILKNLVKNLFLFLLLMKPGLSSSWGLSRLSQPLGSEQPLLFLGQADEPG